MSEEQKQLLQSKLWAIANLLRGKMNPDDYRDYILGFIFFKYLSEKQEIYANELLQGEEVTAFTAVKDPEILEAIREESLIKLGYYLKPDELFSTVAKKGSAKVEGESTYILDDLQEILNHIEQSTMGNDSEDDFAALFEDLDLTSTKLGRTVSARNEIIVKIINELDEIDFRLDEIDSDVLGDAYEYLIGKFAAGAGKTAGEFYTPQEVSTILSKIVTTGKTKIKSVYDPTCGSGSLLLRVAKEADVSEFYGQELNRTTFNLARMNMILHNVHYREFDIRQEDTLEEPQHLNMRFEAIVANPPFSAQWRGNNNPLNSSDERFSQFGRIAPNSKADYAFIMHMYFQLADNGTMACVAPHGVLYRGGAEGIIRKYFIDELNAIDAVIGLPANIFYGTSIPTCILVLKKCREADDAVVFIDASAEENYKKLKNQNELRQRDINKIIEAYQSRQFEEKYSSNVTIADIRENDYNLNIPRYVDRYEEEELRDIEELTNQLSNVNKEIDELDEEIKRFCLLLEIDTPVGYNYQLLQEFKKSIQREIFSRNLRFKDKDGTDFPDWSAFVLSDLGTTFNGLSGKTKENFGAGLPYIQYKQVFDQSYIDIEKCDLVEILPDENQNQVMFGDVFFTTSSETIDEVGFASVLLTEVDEMYLNSFCFGFRINSFDVLDPSFAQFLFRSDKLRREIIRLGQGSTRYNLSKVQMMKIETELPSLDEQILIRDFLSLLDSKIELIANSF